MKIADAKRRARLAQANHPNPNEGIAAPGTDLLNTEEGVAKLVNTGFPLNTIRLMESVFAQFDNASGIAKKGRRSLRRKVDDNFPGGGNGGRRRSVNRLGTGAGEVPRTGANQGDSARQTGRPTLAGPRSEPFRKESVPSSMIRSSTPGVMSRVLLGKSQ